jgi:hypothetical protein
MARNFHHPAEFQDLVLRLERETIYIGFLEAELDDASTGAETSVILSLLQRAKSRVNGIESEFRDRCAA